MEQLKELNNDKYPKIDVVDKKRFAVTIDKKHLFQTFYYHNKQY